MTRFWDFKLTGAPPQLSWGVRRQEGDRMGFPADDERAMLALRGVGPTVVRRLEQLGYASLADLRDADAEVITRRASELVGSTCWRNSPQARAAIQAVIGLARKAG